MERAIGFLGDLLKVGGAMWAKTLLHQRCAGDLRQYARVPGQLDPKRDGEKLSERLENRPGCFLGPGYLGCLGIARYC